MQVATRDQIIEAADRLFHAHGFQKTSFGDIAGVVGISRGNFYYHFRTKDEILDAVIARRLASTAGMLEQWQAQAEDPVGRIGCFIRMLVHNQASIMAHGCPVGTLCTELARIEHPANDDARALFTLFRDWLRSQFVATGRPQAQADMLALHLLARSQGVATLAVTFRDKAFIAHEVAQMDAWLATVVSPQVAATAANAAH